MGRLLILGDSGKFGTMLSIHTGSMGIRCHAIHLAVGNYKLGIFLSPNLGLLPRFLTLLIGDVWCCGMGPLGSTNCEPQLHLPG